MLSRVEVLYLNLLRGFILILATVALVSSLVLGASAIPSLIDRLGEAKADTSTLTLSRFVVEQKPTAQQETDGDFEVPVDPLIARAARNVKQYLGDRSGIPLKAFETGFAKSLGDIPVIAQTDYGDSLVKLTEELKASTGKPLSEARVMSLLAWHQNRFSSEWDKEALRKAEADAAFRYRLLAAGGAFLAFVLVIFVFLFVRVERNTRLVHVAREIEDA